MATSSPSNNNVVNHRKSQSESHMIPEPEPSPAAFRNINKQMSSLSVSDRNDAPSNTIKSSDSTMTAEDLEAEPVRLFVGQVPESMVEPQLTELFANKGIEVIDIAIIRDKHTSRHRHCAFITVPSRKQANSAVEEFHNKKYLESMSNPMQVKEANQPKPKGLMQGYSYSFSPSNALSPVAGAVPMLSPQVNSAFAFQQRYNAQPAAYGMMHPMNYMSMNMNMNMNNQMHVNPMMYMQQFASGQNNKNNAANATPYMYNYMNMMPSMEMQHHQQMYAAMAMQQNESNARFSENINSNVDHDSMRSVSGASFDQQPSVRERPSIIQDNSNTDTTTNNLYAYNYGSPSAVENNIMKSVSYVEGPVGANLFVNNLPDEFTDEDLVRLFVPHGKILSYKVFIDKFTHQSKGFGFVSFGTVHEAQEAIKAKNGYEVQKDRRLIVELKRAKRAKFDFF